MMARMGEELLVKKAEVTVELMGKKGNASPEGFTFWGVTKLCNGGVVYHLDSPESAHWLRSHVKAFNSFFHP